MFFELNCGYPLEVFLKVDINSCTKPKSTDKLLSKLYDLMTIYHKNFYYAYKLQKKTYNISV